MLLGKVGLPFCWCARDNAVGNRPGTAKEQGAAAPRNRRPGLVFLVLVVAQPATNITWVFRPDLPGLGRGPPLQELLLGTNPAQVHLTTKSISLEFGPIH